MNMGFGFAMFEIMFFLVFAIVIGTFIVAAVRGAKQWKNNNQSPRLTVPATIVGKRTDVSHHRHAGEHHHSYSSSTYYVTFQVESGDRMEFRMTGQEYGMLIEGDYGRLTFQGTRYLGFERL